MNWRIGRRGPTGLGMVLLSLTVAMAAQQAPGDPWLRASPARTVRLPEDHVSHPDYKVEWWYYTGNLQAGDGREFGFQLTFFRIGVVFAPSNPSRWAVRDLHVAHLAVTDVGNEDFRFAERMSRGAVGLAGAATDRYRVWNGAWQVERGPDGRHRLYASADDIGVDLVLEEGGPAVPHGRAGFSQKGSQTGNATHYYSLTRMATAGTLTLDGIAVPVTGQSWMDHEFGTSFLETGQRGWDWFSIQLDDESELMLFQLRRDDGSRDPRSAATFVRPTGEIVLLGVDDFSLVPGSTWPSEATGAEYPIAWRLAIPGERLEIAVRALVDDQELATGGTTGIAYWEGAIAVVGVREGRQVEGRGYLEMTGYAGPPLSAVLR